MSDDFQAPLAWDDGTGLPADWPTDVGGSPQDAQVDYAGTYSYDFSTGQFRTEVGGSVSVLAGIDAVGQSAEKVLLTRRYAYTVYSHGYGSDIANAMDIFDFDITSFMGMAAYLAEDALVVDTRVSSVRDLTVTALSPGLAQIEGTVVDLFSQTYPLDVTVSV